MNTHILNYRRECERIDRLSASRNETTIRRSFINLINHYAEEKNLYLLEEEAIKNDKNQNIRPDGVLKDGFSAQYGLYEAKISVIIGNPPYNAHQKNYNDQNANRAYEQIDKRLKATFVEESTAQRKGDVYDMYVRFYRWAIDRLDTEKGGIVAFVSNRSFIDAKAFDGFRKLIYKDFDYIYVVDLGGNIRSNHTGKSIGNVFDIQVGVCIGFVIRTASKPNQRQKLFYYALRDEQSKEEKLDFLRSHKIENIPFESIYPDKNHNWLNLTDNDFEELTPVCSKETKNAKNKEDEKAIFKLFSNGIVTARDEWVYDFDKKNLEKKMRFFSQIYNESAVSKSLPRP